MEVLIFFLRRGEGEVLAFYLSNENNVRRMKVMESVMR